VLWIGVPRNSLKNLIRVDINTIAIINAFEKAVLMLMASGKTIIDNTNYPAYDKVYSIEPQQIVGPAEYKADLAEHFDNLSVNPYNIHFINDLITCTKPHPKEEFLSHNTAFGRRSKTCPGPGQIQSCSPILNTENDQRQRLPIKETSRLFLTGYDGTVSDGDSLG
jgi:hypothetical protein